MTPEDEDLATCGNNDTVSLKNLRLSHGIIAPIWGTPKEQPCLVSIELVLSRGFDSAAGKDALDENTIHYGTLAKSIRAAAGGKSYTLVELHEMIENVVSELSKRPDGSCKIFWAGLTFFFPKASTYGQGVDISTTIGYNRQSKGRIVQRELKLKDVRLMVLIGVNDDERDQKQPVLVDFDLGLGEGSNDNDSSLYDKLFSVEQELAKIIEATTFETLEALANHTVSQLKSEVLCEIPSPVYLRLTLAKPLAVRHADASSVSVFRTLSNEQPGCGEGASTSALKIVKPYV